MIKCSKRIYQTTHLQR